MVNKKQDDEGVLSSLRYYDEQRLKARDVQRFEGTNVDQFTTSDGEDVMLCHLSAIFPFTQGSYIPFLPSHEDLAAVALAAQHLNTGDGSIVPEVTGINERCNVRFTTQFADSEYSAGNVLNHVVLQTMEGTAERLPCAYIGAYRSSISIPMSITTGLFGYPQISGGSTSVDLDDTSQFPLFGRTIPSDQGNAIPIIIYFRKVLQIKHLTVINVNDAYGNAFVEGLRLASQEYAPDMKIHQIPLDEGQSSIEAAIANVKNVGYRFIFCIVFTAETHDGLMLEGYKHGVAGDGLHNWLFADSFAGELDNRVFPKDSPLHKAYTGVGLLEASGGVTGIESYDNFVSKFPELKNPTDLEYLGSLIPTHFDEPNYPDEIPFINDESFLQGPLVSGFAAFVYEAAISIGIAACELNNEPFSGQEHFDQIKSVQATGVAGTIQFDPETGTRLPSSVLYKVGNFLGEDVVDETTGEPAVMFKPTVTDLFQNNEWVEQTPYIFNDGTSKLPADLPPTPDEEEGTNLALVVALPVCLAFLLLVAVYLWVERKRNKNDTVWKVKKEELKFAAPPVIIGRGAFGLVLQAEYRGTQVAVKRVLPERSGGGGLGGDSSHSRDTTDSAEGSEEGNEAHNPGMASGMASGFGLKSGYGGGGGGYSSGYNSSFKSGITSSASPTSGGSGSAGSKIPVFGKMVHSSRINNATFRKKLKDEFVEEMRYLSKLRHPCVTTVMGAVIGKGEEPMLLMEYMEHGSLYDLLHNETMVIEGELLLPLLRDVSQGVRFLHSADPQVIHGDLKSANILVDSRFRAKVSDFGLSQKKNLGGTGTPFWMAPELLREETTNTSATDVYSFGIILYEVYSRRDPYEGEDAREVLRLVADKQIRKRPPVPLRMPEKIKSLMSDCLEDDAEKRPTFEELDMRVKRVDAETADPGFNTVKPSNLSLFDIFPRHVAEALRDGRTVEPEHRDSVTIFFSDIVGFTTISSELEPRKVASLLDRLYTSFDELTQNHDIFKVETIGDAYMAVTNLVKDQPDDHAKRIALFAIDAVTAANSILIDDDDPEKGVVNIRVGFHSGPVVADVVGTRNPRYCLFGDTVNTASRMESNSKENRIHCSRAAAKLLHRQHPELSLKSRGKIKVKGKGEMQTFWVNERRDRSSLLSRAMKSERPSSGLPDRLETIKNDLIDISIRESHEGSVGEMRSVSSSEFLSNDLLSPMPDTPKKTSEIISGLSVLKENMPGRPFLDDEIPSPVAVSEPPVPVPESQAQEDVVVRNSVSLWLSAVDSNPNDEAKEAPPESAPRNPMDEEESEEYVAVLRQ